MDQKLILDVLVMNQVCVNSSDLDLKTKFNLNLVQQAAQNLNLKSSLLGVYQDILKVDFLSKPSLYFWRNRHPFNHGFSELAQDKVLQYQILADFLTVDSPFKLPKTDFIPFTELTKSNLKNIVSNLESNFEYPFILKKSPSSFSADVHLIDNAKTLNKVLNEYLPLNTQRSFLIAQSYIKGDEYRAVTLKGSLAFAYSKIGNSRFNFEEQSAYNPLKITDKEILPKLESTVSFLYAHLKSSLLGLDLIITKSNEVYLIELNYFPVFYHYSNICGSEEPIQLYQELLQEYQNS